MWVPPTLLFCHEFEIIFRASTSAILDKGGATQWNACLVEQHSYCVFHFVSCVARFVDDLFFIFGFLGFTMLRPPPERRRTLVLLNATRCFFPIDPFFDFLVTITDLLRRTLS